MTFPPHQENLKQQQQKKSPKVFRHINFSTYVLRPKNILSENKYHGQPILTTTATPFLSSTAVISEHKGQRLALHGSSHGHINNTPLYLGQFMTRGTEGTFDTRRGTHSIGTQVGAGPDSANPARYGQRNTDDHIFEPGREIYKSTKPLGPNKCQGSCSQVRS